MMRFFYFWTRGTASLIFFCSWWLVAVIATAYYLIERLTPYLIFITIWVAIMCALSSNLNPEWRHFHAKD